MNHSIAESAKLVGINRKTVYKHIRSGRLSATLSATGRRQVETSELMRVYGPLATLGDTPTATTGDTSGDTNLLARLLEEMKLLRKEVASLKEQLALPAPKPEPRPVNEVVSIMARLKSKAAKH